MTNKKRYKALMLDVDGTLTKNQRDSMPSPKVVEAITKAKDIIHIGIATGRPLHMMQYLLDHLRLSGPCIIDGGIQIYDATEKKVIKQQLIDPAELPHVIAIAKKLNIPLLVADGKGEDKKYYDGYPFKDTFGLFTEPIPESLADIFISQFKDISSIVLSKTSSWVPNKVHVSVNHPEATKQHGILEVAKILGITTDDIIGVGDHYNDFPLLMACGLKVAMGNAVEDLKAIADYVAPTVSEDGVADVIERFILHV